MRIYSLSAFGKEGSCRQCFRIFVMRRGNWPRIQVSTEARIPFDSYILRCRAHRVAGAATPLMSSHSASTTWNTSAGSH